MRSKISEISRIRKLREASGMSQLELAEKLGIANSTLSLIERGNQFATLETLYKASQIFGCEVRELVDDQTDRKQKRLDAERALKSIEAGGVDALRDTQAHVTENIVFDIVQGLQTLEYASRKKVLTYVNDLRRASGA